MHHTLSLLLASSPVYHRSRLAEGCGVWPRRSLHGCSTPAFPAFQKNTLNIPQFWGYGHPLKLSLLPPDSDVYSATHTSLGKGQHEEKKNIKIDLPAQSAQHV